MIQLRFFDISGFSPKRLQPQHSFKRNIWVWNLIFCERRFFFKITTIWMQILKDQFHCKRLNFVVPRRHLKTFVTKIFFDILFENILSYSLLHSPSLSHTQFLSLTLLVGVIQHSVKCQILLFLNDVPCPAESLCAFNPS